MVELHKVEREGSAPAEPGSALTVLVIDDEPQIQRLLAIALESEGYRVIAAASGREGLTRAARHRHDLFLIDLGLPDISGMDLLKRLREWTQIPAIVVTVKDSAAEKIEALDAGADDYVTKPFNTGELLARMRSALRRANRDHGEEPVFRSGMLEVDLAAHRVTRGGETIRLTATEFALLRLFIQHAGKLLTHRHILREIWGPAHEHNMQYLRVYMARLREKLEGESSTAPLFETEPGIGYRLSTR